ncbi:MAG: flippase-like domain-containing protein [Deltaproteobacteria bacterium]|nr:flippase-like domain-containing protein [Deltaproteobacteria bacterium]
MSPTARRARALAPYVIAVGALVWVAATTPIAAVGDALEHVSWWRLCAIAVPYILALLIADSIALWVSLRVSLKVSLRFKDVVLVRGASYLLALVNYGAGQGGIVWFLHRRHDVPLARATGAVLLTTGAFLLAVVGAVAGGLALEAVPEANLTWLLWLVAFGLPAYLALVWIRPQFLARHALLAPLFDAGVFGTLAATAARSLHLGILIAAHALAYRLFGIEVPIRAALVLFPIIFLVQALPIAPVGLGPTQATAKTLLARFVAVPGADGIVVAASLGFQAISTLLMVLVGLVCLRWEEAHPATEADPSDTTG